ncbi:MAG: hypothetical protein MSR67_10290, partial [Oscillospiraceae bacterium]|nr:hypothetical protein [Oscillospiraceae bacterium]
LNFYDELQGVNKPDNVQLTNACSQNQQAPDEKFNKPTYYYKKKEIKEERKITLVPVEAPSDDLGSGNSFQGYEDFEDFLAKIEERTHEKH